MDCPWCTRKPADERGLMMHINKKHPDAQGKPFTKALRKKLGFERRQKREAEPSMADLMIDAQISRAMGEPVPDWLMDMMD